MELQPGFLIKMLTAVKAKGIEIPKGDVVTVVEVDKKGITVQDILDNLVILPHNAKYKVLKTTRSKAKLIGAPVPKGTNKLEEGTGLTTRPNTLRLRVLQQAQVVASNAMASDDPIQLSKLAIAGSMLAMSMSPGIDNNSFTRLYQFAKKLSSS